MIRETGHRHAGSRRRVGADTLPCRSTRRRFLGFAAAWPVVGSIGVALAPREGLAQTKQPPGKIWRVGYIVPGRPPGGSASAAFRDGLRELGYVEGRNVAIDSRFAEGAAERLPGLAAELVQLKPDVIVAATPSVTAAVQKATGAIPIVMLNVTDPVANGFVKSLARPGGNITGLSTRIGELGPKQLEMLRELVPKLVRVGVLMHPEDASHRMVLKNVQAAAKSAGVEVLPVEARGEAELESAISLVNKQGGRALVVTAGLLAMHRPRIAELAAKYRLPSIASPRQYAEHGGLLSYGPDVIEPYRRAAVYVDRILKGAKPAELPVEEPTRFTLVVNGRTARALGIIIPQAILVRADRVIE